MARRTKLKVFRTAAGFHDVYVAAPSQKAALRAWGSDADLFAKGMAERVDDLALTEEPLARPGEVIRRSRGSISEHIAALPQQAAQGQNETASPANSRIKTRSKPKPKPIVPKPDREQLRKAEQAMSEADALWDAQEAELNEQFANLQTARRALLSDRERKRPQLELGVDKERARYDKALRDWEGHQ